MRQLGFDDGAIGAHGREDVMGGKVLSRPVASGILLVVLTSAMGPYVHKGFGLRLDHLVIYATLFGLLIATGIARRSIRVTVAQLLFALALTVSAVWTATVSLGAPTGTPWPVILAGLENYLQPVAVLAIVVMVLGGTKSADHEALLRAIAVAVVAVVAGNGCFALATYYFGAPELLQSFLPTPSELGTVASRSMSMGRYLGVFNQPLEAGIAYSVGLVAWAVLVGARSSGRMMIALLIGLVGVVAGGLLSVSKVFFPLGVLLASIVLFAHLRLTGSRIVTLFTFTLVLALGTAVLLETWSGASYLERLVDWDVIREKGVVSSFTGGRFDTVASGDRVVAASAVWRLAPITGLGYWHSVHAGISAALDSAYFEFFGQGGLIGLSLYLAALAAIAYACLGQSLRGHRVTWMTLTLLLLIVFGGLGGPVLTANRASILLNVLLFLALAVRATANPHSHRGDSIRLVDHALPGAPQ